VQLWAYGGLGGAGYTWIPSTGLSDPNISNPLAAPTVTTTYTVTVQEGACTDKADITIEVLDRPSAGYLTSITAGCVPFSVSFLETAVDDISWIWNFGDGNISNDPNPIHTYETPGNYPVTLTVSGAGMCNDRVEGMIISVHDTAHVNFTSNPEFPASMAFPNTEVTFKDFTVNGDEWHWSFGDGTSSEEINPVHQYLDEGTYFVTLSVMNDLGCVSTVTHGPYLVVNPEVFIPNVFSPNDDNVNDVYLVRYTGSQPFLLDIFDRWGNKVFSQRDKYTGWDGKIKGTEAPAGEYYYMVKIGDKNYSGNITLVR
jgi:gliding motility-associated-like protein